MAKCTADHLSLKGKFCPLCGESVAELIPRCSNGHNLKINARFCPSCGEKNPKFSAEASKKANSQDRQNLQADGYKNPNFKIIESSSPLENQSALIASAVNADTTSPLTNINFDESPNNEKKNLFIALSVIGAVILVIALVKVMATGPEPVTVTVEMTVINQQCSEISFGDSWGYSDIPGGQVLLKVDDAETFVGSYELFGTTSALGCKFRATIPGVKSDGTNYSVSMASGRRGTIYSTRSELESNDWTFSLSLGRL